MSKKKRLILGIVPLLVIIILVGYFATRNNSNAGKRDPNQCLVTFYSADDQIIAVESVPKGQAATAPADPVMPPGKIFQAWDKDFSCVQEDMEVRPICIDASGKKNVIAFSGASGSKGETVYMALTLTGEVCISGLDLEITYDSDALALKEVCDEDGALLCNAEIPGIIRMNYVSTQNTVADVDLCGLRFLLQGELGEYPVSIKVISSYIAEEDDSMSKAECTVIDTAVTIQP